MKITLRILIFLAIPFFLFAQEKNLQNVWQPFKYFEGSWSGHETGKAGIGKGTRIYKFIMDSTYFYHENISHFEPQEKNPKGETHEDRGFYSYDRSRKNIVLREFHSEAFVISYILDSTNSTKNKFVFISENTENGPPGLRARLTLDITGDNEFTETFELAFKNKEFSEFLKNYWTRKNE